MGDTIFGKIIRREIPADIVYEDELCLAFRDVNPQAPVHILLIPKSPYERLSTVPGSEQNLLGHLLVKAVEVARQQGCGDAFRLVANNGEGVGQTVHHLHLHILGGRRFQWPPG